MSFINSRYLQQNQYHNKAEFLSPPTTPEEQQESTFHTTESPEEDCWGSVSTEESSVAPSSPSSSCYSSTMAEKPIQIKNKNIVSSIPSHRIKRKPSLPLLESTTKGAFCMPILLKDKNKLQSSNTREAKTKKRKHVGLNKVYTTRSEKEHALLGIPNHKKDHNKESGCSSKDDVSVPINLPILPQSLSVTPNQSDATIQISAKVEEEEEREKEEREEEENLIKKAKTDAAAVYDNLTAESDQAVLFLNKEEWIPSLEVFNRKPTVRISWKGSPLKIRNMPYFEKLHPGEATIAATLRLTPEQYLKCKWALILAAKDAYENNTPFRKSEAQKVCCIDVNKTSVLWNAFGKLGWLGSNWPQ